MPVKVSKYFDNVFHHDEAFDPHNKCHYEFSFRGKIQRWTWFGQLDRNGCRILHNFINYASDTYLAIDSDNKIVGGYSFILEAGYENSIMNTVTED